MAQGETEPRVKLLLTGIHTFAVDYGHDHFEISIPSAVLNRFDPREAIPKAFEVASEALLEYARCFRGK